MASGQCAFTDGAQALSGEALAGAGDVLKAYRTDRYTAAPRVMPCPYLTCWDKPGHNLLQLLHLQTFPLSVTSPL